LAILRQISDGLRLTWRCLQGINWTISNRDSQGAVCSEI
jgi:hypothetical protein